MRRDWVRTAVAAMVAVALEAGAGEGVTVAERHRDRRPAGAPAVVHFEPAAGWRERAARGAGGLSAVQAAVVSEQGAWYTPFDRPGMTPPYDLRGWHPQGTRPEAPR